MTLQEKIDALVEERVQVAADIRALLEKDTMSEDETKSYDENIARNKDIKIHIERLEVQITDEDDMRTSAKAPIKEDPEATPQENRQEIVQIEHRDFVYKSLGEELRDIAQWVQYSHPLALDHLTKSRCNPAGSGAEYRATEITGANETNPTEGGFLVQEDFAAELTRRRQETGLLNKMAQHITIGANSNSYKYNFVNETSRANGYRGGGIAASWVKEGGAATATKPTFGQSQIDLRKLVALIYVTDEQLADSTQLTSMINADYPAEINYMIDDGMINGLGSNDMLGILNHTDPNGATVSVAKESAQIAATIVVENIIDMWNALLPAARFNAKWFINLDVERQLNRLEFPVGTGGVPAFLPPGGLSVAPYATLYGREVIPIEQCPVLGTAGDIILFDPSSYIIIEKGGINSASSIHVNFTNFETAFRFSERLNGQPRYAKAIAAAKGGTRRSEAVVLETRA